MRKKLVSHHVTYLSLLSSWPLDPYCLCLEAKAKCLFRGFFSILQASVALSQLKKRHEINVMSMAFSHETPRQLVKVTLHSPLIPWQYCESEMEDVCLLRLSAYDVLQLQVVISTHRHSYFADWIRVWCLSEERHHFHSVVYTVCCSPQWSVFSVRTSSSCGALFPFDVIFQVISSFLSPGPCLTPPSPSPSKVLAAWRIVWTCIDPLWDYSWVIGELDWASSHQGRLTTRCLLGCHFSAGTHCWLCDCPYMQVTVCFWTMHFYTFFIELASDWFNM